MGKLFHLTQGVIPACDVSTIEEFKQLIERTCTIEGIVGYKVGCTLALSYGLPKLTEIAAEQTDLPLIYDHQKAGTDIPQMGDKFAAVCAKAGVKAVIIFPQAGPATEKAFIKALFQSGLVPWVGGEMTHEKYLSGEGGFLVDDAPKEMYNIGAEYGVEYFVVPGNKPDIIGEYNTLISETVKEPKFCMPGIGSQGGEIRKAFEAVKGKAAYAIIGSAIYKSRDVERAASRFCEEALEFL
ncbi:MAG: orotidine 5'-phosphate decarboxylase / HUMPS family protein [Halobacteriota archaeon]